MKNYRFWQLIIKQFHNSINQNAIIFVAKKMAARYATITKTL